jgi:hypothetical protein
LYAGDKKMVGVRARGGGSSSCARHRDLGHAAADRMAQPQLRPDCSLPMRPFSHRTIAWLASARNRAVDTPMMTTSAWLGGFRSDRTRSTGGDISAFHDEDFALLAEQRRSVRDPARPASVRKMNLAARNDAIQPYLLVGAAPILWKLALRPVIRTHSRASRLRRQRYWDMRGHTHHGQR